jgi:oxygen-independent coproporphyrinogen-3 oxidase
VFHARPPEGLPDEESLYEIQDAGGALLRTAGFEQYEVSAWARDGRRCRHNLNYWQFGDYLGVGAGAHGKVTDGRGAFRYRKPANPLQYMRAMEANTGGGEVEPIGGKDLLFEFMLNALRLTDGFHEAACLARTALSAEQLEQASSGAVTKGLLERGSDSIWRPTDLGRRFLNDLQAEFLRNS